jgi:hypothetical protein
MTSSIADSNISMNITLLETIIKSPIEISLSKLGLALIVLKDS